MDEEFSKVADIDELDGIVRGTGSKHLTALRNAPGPVGEPVTGVLGADNQTGRTTATLPGMAALAAFSLRALSAP